MNVYKRSSVWSVMAGLVCSPVLAISVFGVPSASAVAPSAGWMVHSVALPTNFSQADAANADCSEADSWVQCDAFEVTVTNAGNEASDGSPVVLSDAVPEGVTVKRVALLSSTFGNGEFDLGGLLCTTVPMRCEYPGAFAGVLPEAFSPDETLKLTVYVTVNEGTSGSLVNTASVSGGGAPAVSTEVTARVGGKPGFGMSSFDFYSAGLDGARDTQAGDHPYELTVTGTFNSAFRYRPDAVFGVNSVQDPKDVVVDLPLGYVGSILSAPQCTFAELSAHISAGVGGCPKDTIIGHIITLPTGTSGINGPIYNMTPERGVPAEFAYVDVLAGAHVFYTHLVPTPQGYVLQTTNPDIPQIPLSQFVVSFYGTPALRDGSGNAQIPFFTNPTGCGSGPMVAKLWMDSWQHPGSYNPDGTPNFNDPAWVSGEKATSTSPAVTGCNALRFVPEISAQPTTHEADKPSGLDFEIKQPQPEETGTPAASTLKKAVVTLPEGFTVDPSAGDGLAACSEAQVGWVGPSTMSFNPAQPSCPEASKIGSLELSTPLVPNVLTGELYLAAQNANPFGSTLAAYLVVDDPVTGLLIKVAGKFTPDPGTGRLTAVFDENPQAPFSDLKLHFFGGPRAELATPENCGTFTTSTELTPWSAPDSGLPATPFDSFSIDEACPGGFSPSFAALSTNVQAGAYTPFEVSFARSDTDQELRGLSVTLPPGLLASVGSVPLCPEADANAGTCPEASRVGSVVTSVGPGPNPLQVQGNAYLTGPYNGGPYGLAVVVPAIAGPYNFGTVVVRQSLRIDPNTAQVTDVSDPFPTIIDGIPLRLRRVDVTLDRAGFTFNPTSCAKLAFNGGIAGSPLGSPRRLNGAIGYATQPGASSSFTTPFQVTNCQGLKFQPKFSVTTNGKTSKANGASLTAKLSYPNLPQGSETNIARVKVELPKQLPSRLTTLQKACTAAQFNTNPAGCPSASKIGYATVHTPILATPLTGPAIFVSHGGEAFPSLTMVLQGSGVTVELVGTTFISKAGVTSTTFKTVPDTPFSTFELTLPQGKYSALTANGNLCASKLAMPTEFVAQNGMVLHQTTSVGVTGCPKKKALTRAQKLTLALKTCHKEHGKAKRQKCERIARKRYAPVKTKKQAKKK